MAPNYWGLRNVDPPTGCTKAGRIETKDSRSLVATRPPGSTADTNGRRPADAQHADELTADPQYSMMALFAPRRAESAPNGRFHRSALR